MSRKKTAHDFDPEITPGDAPQGEDLGADGQGGRDLPPPPFSRPYEALSVPNGGRYIKLAASDEECAAIARAFKLLAVRALALEGTLAPVAGGPILRLTARLTAEVEQACVVTLDPVPQTLDEPVSWMFGPGEDDRLAGAKEIHLEVEDDDPPDPIEHGMVDLGVVATEVLALGLDPFPRAPGARFDPPPEDGPKGRAADGKGADSAGEETASGGNNPFAVLAALRKK